MSNDRFNTPYNDTEPQSGPQTGQKPLPAGPKDQAIPMRTAKWPGLPGKAGPDRSAGVPEEKVYPYAQGIRGGSDDDPGPSKDPSLGGKY